MRRWVLIVQFITPFSVADCMPVEAPLLTEEEMAIRYLTVLGDSTARDWPSILQTSRQDYYVINHAAGSATTQIIGVQWTKNTKLMRPSTALVVLGGVNDIGLGLGHQVAFDNLTTIYNEAVALGIDVYAMTVFPGPPDYRTETEALNDLIRAVSNVTVIDMYNQFYGHPEYYEDTTHHNAAGLNLVAAGVAAALAI